jgi:hypothetical protein
VRRRKPTLADYGRTVTLDMGATFRYPSDAGKTMTVAGALCAEAFIQRVLTQFSTEELARLTKQ